MCSSKSTHVTVTFRGRTLFWCWRLFCGRGQDGGPAGSIPCPFVLPGAAQRHSPRFHFFLGTEHCLLLRKLSRVFKE
jgi:hypothetical protein